MFFFNLTPRLHRRPSCHLSWRWGAAWFSFLAVAIASLICWTLSKFKQFQGESDGSEPISHSWAAISRKQIFFLVEHDTSPCSIIHCNVAQDKWITSRTLKYPRGRTEKKRIWNSCYICYICYILRQSKSKASNFTSLGTAQGIYLPLGCTHCWRLSIGRILRISIARAWRAMLRRLIQAMFPTDPIASQLQEVSLHGFQPIIQGLGNQSPYRHPKPRWEKV